jgi:hypothetical protein
MAASAKVLSISNARVYASLASTREPHVLARRGNDPSHGECARGFVIASAS